jgi:meso-butanediol dehydrogenase / (S,S)-butanediol dehydrogenase / diacetyl reductase
MDGRVVLVTGGARGIGLGIAEAFLAAGARVMIAALGAYADSGAYADPGARAGAWSYDLADRDALQQAASARAGAGEIRATELDVTVAASCEAAVQATLDAYGALDVLVNNAGIVQSGPIENFSEADWDRIFAVNVKGIFLMTRAALPALLRSANAAVINTASIAGKKGYPNMAAYCGSKFAVIGITQSLAAELASDNVRVNAICPGMVGTAMWLEHLLPSNTTDLARKQADFEQAMHDTIPLGRPQTVADMGQAAVFLATAPNITGISLSVAGGFEMN